MLSKNFPKEEKGISELFKAIKRLGEEAEKLPTPYDKKEYYSIH
jgi:hypothetical protein